MYFNKGVPRSAACLAYFLLLAIFPALICINAFLVLLHLDSTTIISDLVSLLPNTSIDVFRSYLNYISVHQSTALFTAGLLMTITCCSAAFRTLMQALAEVYDVRPRSGLHRFVSSLFCSVLFLAAVYLSVVVIFTGDWFFARLNTSIRSSLVDWKWLRFILLFAVSLLMILLISRLSVPRETPPGPLLLGSLLSSFALVASSALFSWFIGTSTQYSLVYGSLVSLIALLVWLYLCGNILILGNVCSCVWFRLYPSDGGPADISPF